MGESSMFHWDHEANTGDICISSNIEDGKRRKEIDVACNSFTYLYAFLISSCEASGLMPSWSYSFVSLTIFADACGGEVCVCESSMKFEICSMRGAMWQSNQ